MFGRHEVRRSRRGIVAWVGMAVLLTATSGSVADAQEEKEVWLTPTVVVTKTLTPTVYVPKTRTPVVVKTLTPVPAPTYVLTPVVASTHVLTPISIDPTASPTRTP
jgi:hypothetical protein